MVLAYLVYIFLPSLMILSLCKVSNGIVSRRHIYVNRYLLSHIVIIITAIVIGFRYGVGTDYFSYEQLYLTQDSSTFADKYGIEFLFYGIYTICYRLGLSYNVALCVLNMIPIYFLYKRFRGDVAFAWIVVMLFLSGQFFMHLNIVRQSVAMFVLLYATRYIIDRSFLKFAFWVFVAMGFHVSAILFLPVYYIPRLSPLLERRRLQYVIFFTAFLSSSFILNHIIGLMMELMQYTPYAQYGGLIANFEISKGSGVGVIIKFLMDFVIIHYSVRLVKAYEISGFSVFYLIYFCGCVLSQIFGLTSLLLLRLIFLFESFRFVISGYLFHYLFHKSGWHQIVFAVLMIMYIGYFLGMIYLHNNDCSPYEFAI